MEYIGKCKSDNRNERHGREKGEVMTGEGGRRVRKERRGSKIIRKPFRFTLRLVVR